MSDLNHMFFFIKGTWLDF